MVDDFVEEYSLRTQQVDSTQRQSITQKQGKEVKFVILLVGSMGSIGCHLIAHLARLPIFKEVVRLISRCWS